MVILRAFKAPQLKFTIILDGDSGRGDASGTSHLHVTFEHTLHFELQSHRVTNPLNARPLSEKS